MAKYPNFYENINEALSRLRQTVILYDGHPYYIHTITDHKNDGKFRVYMSSVEVVGSLQISIFNQLPHGHSLMGPKLDAYMAEHPDLPLLRKQMDSPLFNRFRPFPLGMCNSGANAFYLERYPARPHMTQGLQQNMVSSTKIACVTYGVGGSVNLFTESFRDCVLGHYPSPKEVLEKLRSDRYLNESVAFHREFALVKGPIGTLFLAYKEGVVGDLPELDFSRLRLDKSKWYLKEAIEDLNLFITIVR